MLRSVVVIGFASPVISLVPSQCTLMLQIQSWKVCSWSSLTNNMLQKEKRMHIIILLHSITDPSQVQQVMFAEIEWPISWMQCISCCKGSTESFFCQLCPSKSARLKFKHNAQSQKDHSEEVETELFSVPPGRGTPFAVLQLPLWKRVEDIDIKREPNGNT